MRNKGQSIIEYIILVGIVVIALYAMGPAFKRGVQSVIRGTADQLAVQENAEQDFSTATSHLDLSNSDSRLRSGRTVTERNYELNIAINEVSETSSVSMTNMGFMKQ